MNHTGTILTEMQSIAPSIAAIGNAMPYSVDAQYFEILPELLIEQVSFVEAIAHTSVPYQVPSNYFDGLSTQLQNKIATTPNSLVPAKKSPALVIGLNQTKKWLSYAAAAILAGILITNAFLFTDKPNYSEYETFRNLDIPSTLNSLSDADLSDYIQSNSHINGVEEMVVSENEALPNLTENIASMTNENIDAYLQDNKLLEHNNFSDPIK